MYEKEDILTSIKNKKNICDEIRYRYVMKQR
jgi:hypothetical protein